MEDTEKLTVINNDVDRELGLTSVSAESVHEMSEQKAVRPTHSVQPTAVNSGYSNTDLDNLSFSGRLNLIREILEYINKESQSIDEVLVDSKFFSMFPILKQYKSEAVINICNSAFFSKNQQNNVAVAVIIFFILTRGKSPEDVWHNSIESYANTELGDFSLKTKEIIASKRNIIGSRQANEILDSVKRARFEQEKRDIDSVITDCSGVGAVKIFEMLWEVFITKYGNYDVKLWSRKISEFCNKTYKQRCTYKESSNNVEIYAVSSEGRLDKPGHTECEDYSYVKIYDESMWLAAVADGVGSCKYSKFGSQTATNVLEETILEYLGKNDFIKNKRKIFYRRITDKDWSGLMYFLKYSLAKVFYDKWEGSIKRSEYYQYADCTEISEFSTTLQFAFGCEKFVACGRLGDGGFYVRKKEQVGQERLYGGVALNDGISGVTRQEVLTVPNLKTNPQSLVVDFFNTNEVADIIITSDGVDGAMGKTTEQMGFFVSNLSAIPFNERCEKLQNIANMCADYNETYFGSGDDSTIAFIHFKKR